jgi:integrase/recombinase XerD
MALGRQAKILTSSQLQTALREASRDRYPLRDRANILLSAKAGLRAGEIANLTWSMVLTANGAISDYIALTDGAACQRRSKNASAGRSKNASRLRA